MPGPPCIWKPPLFIATIGPVTLGSVCVDDDVDVVEVICVTLVAVSDVLSDPVPTALTVSPT
jgi:hypothetical protein